MKNYSLLTLLMAFCLSATALIAQEHSDTSKKSISFANQPENKLLIKNINGAVTVEGYSGNTIELEVRRKISAKTEKLLQEGVADVSMAVKEDGNTMVIYMDAPFASLKKDSGGDWNYHVQDNQNKYEYEFDLILKVPDRLKLDASTVNGGVLKISNFSGPLEANNVNGGVELTNVGGSISAKTVNGLITASLNSIPESEGDYSTVNGDIKVFFPAALAADVSFNTMNGDFYTDFENVTQKPQKTEKSKKTGKAVTVYQIDRSGLVSVNGGGNPLKFKTLNGDIYLQKLN